MVLTSEIFAVRALCTTTLHVLRRFKKPLKEKNGHTISPPPPPRPWKEGWSELCSNLGRFGALNGGLQLCMEMMRNPEWRLHFDLTFLPILNASYWHLIGLQSSSFYARNFWLTQKILPSSAVLLAAQLNQHLLK